MPAVARQLWSVLEEHLDEAGFLTGLWRAALRSPSWTVAQLATGVEERLAANIEGLVVAGPPARERLLAPALAGDDPDLAFAAALAVLEQPGGLALLQTALGEAAAEIAGALSRAIVLSRGPADAAVAALLTDPHPAAVGAGLAAFARRGLDVGPPLLGHLASAEVEIAVPALRAALCSTQPVRGAVERALTDPRPPVRDAALEAGLRLGFRSALSACRRLAEAMAPDAGRALQLLSASGDPADAECIERAVGVEPLRAPALAALGCSGFPRSVEVLLEAMETPGTARIAGEAFSAITGVVLEGALVGEEPADEGPPAFEEDDLEADLVPAPEAELPLPDAGAVAKAWGGMRDRLVPRGRHLDGRPFAPEALARCFAGASMRRRRLLAPELAIRSRGSHPACPDDFALEQRRAERRATPTWPSGAAGPLARLLQG